jgi:hypothetical protein
VFLFLLWQWKKFWKKYMKIVILIVCQNCENQIENTTDHWGNAECNNNVFIVIDVEKLSKMKKLLEILSNPSKRMPLETLLKCEVVLEKLDFKRASVSTRLSEDSLKITVTLHCLCISVSSCALWPAFLLKYSGAPYPRNFCFVNLYTTCIHICEHT